MPATTVSCVRCVACTLFCVWEDGDAHSLLLGDLVNIFQLHFQFLLLMLVSTLQMPLANLLYCTLCLVIRARVGLAWLRNTAPPFLRVARPLHIVAHAGKKAGGVQVVALSAVSSSDKPLAGTAANGTASAAAAAAGKGREASAEPSAGPVKEVEYATKVRQLSLYSDLLFP